VQDFDAIVKSSPALVVRVQPGALLEERARPEVDALVSGLCDAGFEVRLEFRAQYVSPASLSLLFDERIEQAVADELLNRLRHWGDTFLHERAQRGELGSDRGDGVVWAALVARSVTLFDPRVRDDGTVRLSTRMAALLELPEIAPQAELARRLARRIGFNEPERKPTVSVLVDYALAAGELAEAEDRFDSAEVGNAISSAAMTDLTLETYDTVARDLGIDLGENAGRELETHLWRSAVQLARELGVEVF
jgi:hypothetical protein